jgi:flagellar hook-basal body complex protein FliE
MNPIRLKIAPQEVSFPDAAKPAQNQKPQESFKDVLGKFVNSVNDLQQQAASAERSFLKGETEDLHQVMIAVEEASVAFELLMEIRNKLLESYQQIMRTAM